MFSRAKITYSRALGAGLGIFLAAMGGVSGPGFAPVMLYAQTPHPASSPISPACKAILDANDKLFATPFHMYMTQTTPAIENGKPVASETVFAGGAEYVLINGKWSPSPVSQEELKALEQRNRKTARMTCHYVHDESVSGEKAALYTSHGESAHGKNDNQIWISRTTGLILRQETDMDTGRANGKAHLSVRYEYSNVQAPKL